MLIDRTLIKSYVHSYFTSGNMMMMLSYFYLPQKYGFVICMMYLLYKQSKIRLRQIPVLVIEERIVDNSRKEDLPKHFVHSIFDLMTKSNTPIDDCPICYNQMKRESMIITGCCHTLCITCRSQIDNCPICRSCLSF